MALISIRHRTIVKKDARPDHGAILSGKGEMVAVDRAPNKPAESDELTRSAVSAVFKRSVAANGNRTRRLIDQANEQSEAARQETQTGKIKVIA
jgi:hypothetical protein